MSLPLLHAGRTNPGLSAALDLRFALDKSLTAYRGPTPSFSRASTGSYFDGSGVLRYAALNYLTYSEDLTDGSWVKNNSSISANSATSPDGKQTADKIVENTASSTSHRVYHAISISSLATFSAYFKAAGRNFVRVILYPGVTLGAYFDLINGTVISSDAGITGQITSAGNGWFRCSVTYSGGGTSTWAQVHISPDGITDGYTGDGSSGIYMWGAQLEASSTVGTYCPTTSSANSAPRFNHTYNGTSWVSRGLLVEEQRTNNILQSQDLTTTWTANRGSIISNATVAPDGTTTADRFVENTANGVHGPVQTPVTTTSAAYTVSGFFRAGSRSIIVMRFQDFATGLNGVGAEFNLSTGTISSPAVVIGAFTSPSATISNVGGGWYRCTVTGTANTTQCSLRIETCTTAGTFSAAFFQGSSYTGDGSSYFDSWGYQLELGSFATSYIPTTSASATRSADVCQITGSDFSGFWNGTEGSIAVEFDRLATVGLSGYTSPRVLTFRTDDNNNIQAYCATPGGPYGEYAPVIYNGGAFQGMPDSIGSAIAANTSAKIAFCYKANDFAGTLNGAAVVTDNSGTIPAINQLHIGAYSSANLILNGHIARLRYFKKRLPNATLQQLSEPDPTLNLQFALNKSLTPVAGPAPSFSRASTGTYFNSSGVLTSAAINAPRFDHTYDGTSWISKGLLIEEQRTNAIANSNAFSTSFSSGSAQLASAAAISPDGTNNAWKIYESAPAGGSLDQRKFATISISGQNTISIFAKAAERKRILLFANGPNQGSWFDLSTGVSGNVDVYTGATQSMQPVGNGWYRCSMTVSISTTTVQIQIMTDGSTTNPNRIGDGVSGIYIAFIQGETGAFSTSYIPTTTTSVVRSADVCQITGTSFGSMWNQGEGSVVSTFDRIDVATQSPFIWDASGTGGSNNNAITFTPRASGSIYLVSNGGVAQVDMSLGVQDSSLNQSSAAVAYKLNDFAGSLNGASVLTDTLGTIPTTTKLDFGFSTDYPNAPYRLNGHIAKLVYYPARLTNTKLQQLST